MYIVNINRTNDCYCILMCLCYSKEVKGSRCLSGRASDSGARGRGFEMYM